MKQSIPIGIALAATLFISAGNAQGQENDDVIELSPFHVQAQDDAAYQTTNSQSATRMNVPLKDVPFNLQVVNRQFIEDTMAFGGQAFGFGGGANREAVSWMGSVEGKNIRGINSLEFLRNGFLRYSDNGSATIEKVEVVKGPNSILDGVTKPGGVINVVTKKPNPHRDFTRFKLLYGNPLDRTIANFDVNRRVLTRGDGKALATFRLVGGLEKSDYITEHRKRRLENIMPSLTINFNENTLLGLQHEYYYVNGERGNNDRAFRSAVNVDDPHGGTLNGAVPLMHYFNGNYEEGIINKGASWDGPDLTESFPEIVNDTLISFEHRFSDAVVFNVDYNFHNRSVDWGPTINNQGAVEDPDGTWYWERRRFQFNPRLQTVEGFRGQVAWHMDIAEQRHKFVAGFLSQEDINRATSNIYSDGTGHSMDRIPMFATNPDLSIPDPVHFIPRIDKNHRTVETLSFYMNHHTKWLDGKLITLLGVYDASLDLRDTATNRTDPSKPIGALVKDNQFKESNLSPQIGAVYQINDTVGLYLNYSQSMDSNGGKTDGFDNAIGPKQGEIYEIGSKFRTADQKISGTISVFEITESNSAQFDITAPNRDNPTADPDDQFNPPGANVGIGEFTSTGFDVDIYFYPMENFNTVFSYGYKDVKTTFDTDASKIGRKGNDFDHKLSVFNKYTWSEGNLEGLSANMGLVWRSERQRTHNRFGAPAYIDARYTLQAGLGYKWGGDKYQYKLNFAAKNLFKLDQETSGWVPGTRDAYYQDLSEEFLLSFDVEF